MDDSGDLFHASTRLASTANLRGTPSSGRAFNATTRTICPPALFFRRTGSSQTARPAARGTTVMIAPRTFDASFFKKPRRSLLPQDSHLVFSIESVWDEFAESPVQKAKRFATGLPAG